jgi:hypothetical protein
MAICILLYIPLQRDRYSLTLQYRDHEIPHTVAPRCHITLIMHTERTGPSQKDKGRDGFDAQ